MLANQFMPSAPGGFSPTPMPPAAAGDPSLSQIPPDILAKLGGPEGVARLRASVAGLPPDQAVAALQQNLLSIPGVRESLMARMSPQNSTIQPAAPPPTAVPPAAAVPPMGGPTPMISPTPDVGGAPMMKPPQGMDPANAAMPDNAHGGNPRRFQGRLRRGMGLPPGQGGSRPPGGVQPTGIRANPIVDTMPAPQPTGFQAYRAVRMRPDRQA